MFNPRAASRRGLGRRPGVASYLPGRGLFEGPGGSLCSSAGPARGRGGQIRVPSHQSGGAARVYTDAEADVVSAGASTAMCVQRFDDSRNSAIHTTYRISLRSSSLREPRYPLLRVVSVRSRAAGPPGVRASVRLVGCEKREDAARGPGAPAVWPASRERGRPGTQCVV